MRLLIKIFFFLVVIASCNNKGKETQKNDTVNIIYDMEVYELGESKPSKKIDSVYYLTKKDSIYIVSCKRYGDKKVEYIEWENGGELYRKVTKNNFANDFQYFVKEYAAIESVSIIKMMDSIKKSNIPPKLDYFFPVKERIIYNHSKCIDNSSFIVSFFATSEKAYQDRIIGVVSKGRNNIIYFGYRYKDGGDGVIKEILLNKNFFEQYPDIAEDLKKCVSEDLISQIVPPPPPAIVID